MTRKSDLVRASLFTCSFFFVLASVVPAVASPAWNYVSASGQNFTLFRAGGTSVYDPVSNEMILFGGTALDPAQGYPHLNDVWVLSNANGLGGPSTWTNLIANGAPGSPAGRHNHSAVYDSANNRMIIYGGCEGGCYPLGYDIWVLINANGQGGTPTWQQLSPSGNWPSGRQAHQAVYDPTTNSMIVWGGQNGGGSCGGYNDVYVLSNANGLGGTPVWSQVVATNASKVAPTGQYYANAVYDATNNVMTVFGGTAMTGYPCTGLPSSGTYTLSHANGTGGPSVWKKISAGSSSLARSSASMVYNPISNHITVFGGNGTTAPFADAWTLSNANGMGGASVWKKLAPTFTFWQPSTGSRWNNQGIDITNDRMIINGGSNADGPFWSTWALSDADNQ